MSNQNSACTRGDRESRYIHDWRARKKEIARRFELEDLKFDSYCDLQCV